jgi:hypothetical protein
MSRRIRPEQAGLRQKETEVTKSESQASIPLGYL